MSKKKKIAIGVTVSIALLLVLMTVLLPHIVKEKAAEAIGTATGRKSTIGAVSFNPFTLTLTVDDLRIDDREDGPFVSIARVRGSLSAASLLRRALVLDELTVDGPKFRLVRTAPHRYNFSDILDRQLKSSGKKSGKFLFSLNNIVIRHGAIDFSDRALGRPRAHTVRNLELGIPFISNIPYYAESYVSPKVSAVVNGTPFSLDGRSKPLSTSMETSLHLGLERLSVPQYVAYAPVAPPVHLTSGFLTLDAVLSYRVSSERKPELALSGVLRVDEAGVALQNGKPLAKLPRLEVKARKLDFAAKNYDFSSVLIDGLELFVSRNRSGEWVHSRLLPKGAKGGGAEKKGVDAAKPPVHLSSFILRNGAVHFRDDLPSGGFRATISAIDAAVKGFSTAEGRTADYQLGVSLDRGGRFESAGSFSVASGAFSGNVELTDLDLERGWPYLAPHLAAPVQGRLAAAANLLYSRADRLSVKDGKIAVRNLSTRYGAGDGLALGSVEATGFAYGQSLNRLEVSDITVSRGSVSLSREEDGSLSPLSLLRHGGSGKAASGKAARPAKASSAPPFSYHIGKIACSGINVAFTDRTREGAPRFTLNHTRLGLTNLTGSRLNPAGLQFSSTYGKDAPVSLSGSLVPAPFSYSGTVHLGRLPLRDFEAYLPSDLNVFLVGGVLNADLKLNVSLKDGKPAGSFRGSAGVRDFYSMDTVSEQDLLKWESLHFDGIHGEVAPFALDIRQIVLNKLYSRIIVMQDGTLNLQHLVAREAPAQSAAAKGGTSGNSQGVGGAAGEGGTGGASASVPPVRRIAIGAVTVQDGTVDFSDLHLPQPFSTTFHQLGGRVSGLSSDEQKFAEVDLRGNLENRSPLQITGRINPLREDLLVDLKVSFRDIELPGVSPYSGTYLGYRVDQGKLFLDLKYLIEKKTLNSENKVFIDQFTFGEKVESPKATALPVRLAVALLKDKNGEIHLDLPVTGRTDDPQFSVWGVAWQMVKNIFTKAANAPLALLSSLAGASTLTEPEAEKLQQLAKVLAERPGIRLEVAGYVEREKDAEGYRLELLTRKLKGEKFLQLAKEKRLAPGQSAESLEILPEEHSKLLKGVYEKEKFPKPRTVLGTLKHLPDAEMTKLILANTAVGDPQLRALAHERCATVMAYLVGEGRLPQERVFEKLGDIHAGAGKDGAGGRVEFGVVEK